MERRNRLAFLGIIIRRGTDASAVNGHVGPELDPANDWTKPSSRVTTAADDEDDDDDDSDERSGINGTIHSHEARGQDGGGRFHGR